MADKQSNNSQPLRPDDAVIGSIPGGEEAWKLLDIVLDGRATREQEQRLEHLAFNSRQIARMCIRASHLWYGLQLHIHQSHLAGEAKLDELERTEGVLEGGLTETMVLPAVREERVEQPLYRDPLFDAIPPDAPAGYVIVPEPQRRWPWITAAAAAIAVGATGLMVWLARPAPQSIIVGPTPTLPDRPANSAPPPPTIAAQPAAMLTAVTAAAFDGRPAPDPGTPLATGHRVRLTAGAVEIKFTSGAVAVVTAPAQFRVADQNALALESGSVAARVPPPAIGFSVTAPGLTVIDQGTDFGVRTLDGDSAAETAVFTGKVDAVATNAAKQPTAEPLRLIAGQAVQHDVTSGDTTPSVATFTPDVYTREIEKYRMPLNLIGTGQGVSPTPGTPTPDWQITAVPNDANWTPRAAVITESPTEGNANTFPGLRWISLASRKAALPPGDYVFRTRLDLTGFDPSTVMISAQAVSDGEIVEVRANGTTSAVHRALPAQINAYLLELSGLHWVVGPNDVDVVVRTRVIRQRTTPSVALGVRWLGTGSPVVRR